MATYEIDLSIRTHLKIDVEAEDADAAWALGGELLRRNVLDAPVTGLVTAQYVEEIDMVRRKQVEGAA